MGLSRISVAGYKTIENLDSFEPRSLSVLIGPNGAGKSNLISFFRLLSNLLSGNLRVYVGLAGGAAKLLHDGPQRTQVISASITIESEAGVNEYSFGLGYASQDTFVFLHEQYRYTPHAARPAQWTDLDAGHRESRLRDFIEERRTARTIHGMLQKLIVHQFHNTSRTARMKETWSVADGRWLKEDAANLAPFLYRLQTSHPPYYRRIVQTFAEVCHSSTTSFWSRNTAGFFCSGGKRAAMFFSMHRKPPMECSDFWPLSRCYGSQKRICRPY